MSTLTPAELLNLWKQEQMTIEMALGHILQNLAKQQTVLATLLTTQNKLGTEVNSLQQQILNLTLLVNQNNVKP